MKTYKIEISKIEVDKDTITGEVIIGEITTSFTVHGRYRFSLHKVDSIKPIIRFGNKELVKNSDYKNIRKQFLVVYQRHFNDVEYTKHLAKRALMKTYYGSASTILQEESMGSIYSPGQTGIISLLKEAKEIDSTNCAFTPTEIQQKLFPNQLVVDVVKMIEELEGLGLLRKQGVSVNGQIETRWSW